MKIKEYADGKGLTKGAVYKAIIRNGHSAGELTDKRGNLTAKGMQILDEIYQEPDQEPLSEPLKETRPDDSVLEDLKAVSMTGENDTTAVSATLPMESEFEI